VMASTRSPAAISVSPQPADLSEFENTTLGISFIGLANGPEAPGQEAGPARVGGGTHEVRKAAGHRARRPAAERQPGGRLCRLPRQHVSW
jgi:hypothetical protein